MSYRLNHQHLAVLVLLFLVALYQIVSTRPDDKLHMIVCDVGQGDAILIMRGYNQMLIDGGRDEKILTCLKQHLPWGDKSLEIVVATHADADHTGGLDRVIEQFSPRLVVLPLCYKNTAGFSSLYALVQRKKITGTDVLWIDQLTTLHLDDQVSATRLWPEVERGEQIPGCSPYPKTTLQDTSDQTKSQKDDTNAWSSVLLLNFNQIKILLTADIDTGVEQALITSGSLDRINVLKVAHHGSKSSTSQRFIDVTRPETSLISVGKNNSYKHPAPEVLRILDTASSRVWRTDLSGNLELTSDGQSYSVKEQSTSNLFDDLYFSIF